MNVFINFVYKRLSFLSRDLYCIYRFLLHMKIKQLKEIKEIKEIKQIKKNKRNKTNLKDKEYI